MSDPSLADRAYASALRMHGDNSGMRRPQSEDFAHLATAAVATAPPPDEGKPTAPPPEPGWNAAAFDQLPAELRAPVMAGAAHHLGHGALQLAAERELLRPEDIHLHLTDPSKYVDGDGRIDRAAIQADLERLTRERPELSRYGNGPGQEGARPEDRPRRAVPGSGVGARTPVTNTDAVEACRARMQAASGVKFADG